MSPSGSVPQTRVPLASRLASALRRRGRYLRQLLGRNPPPREEQTLQWLLSLDTGEGLPADSRHSIPCPGLTGASIETALAYGCREEAIRWARWLMAILRPDGAMPDVRRPGEASFRCTAQAAAGLLAVVPELPEAEEAARRTCACLSAWLSAVERPGSTPSVTSRAAVGPHGGKPPDVLPLVEAGQRWPESGWLFEATRVVDRGIYRPDVLVPFVGSEQSSARRVETLIAMDRKPTASQVLEEVAAQRDCLLTARRAQLAALWYRVDMWERADGAMCCLERLQHRDGSFPAYAGWLPPKNRRYRDTWTAKYYLDAALLRVRASFEARWQEFPQTIDDRDGRMRAVYDWFALLPVGARVADVGCGKGRFLRHLVRYFPAAQLVGIDVSPAMLSFLPPGVTARDGSILRTGLADGELEGAFAVESLEHSLVPQRAIAELCRIVRPGGSILVIDKDRRRQPLSQYDPWERWFTPEDLIRWLIPYCRDIATGHVPHGEGLPGTDLFLAVTATRNEP